MQNKKSFFVIGMFALVGVTLLSFSFAGSGDGFVNLEPTNPSGGALSVTSPDASDGEYIEFATAASGSSQILSQGDGNDWSVPVCDVRASNSGIYWTDTHGQAPKHQILETWHGTFLMCTA